MLSDLFALAPGTSRRPSALQNNSYINQLNRMSVKLTTIMQFEHAPQFAIKLPSSTRVAQINKYDTYATQVEELSTKLKLLAFHMQPFCPFLSLVRHA